MSSSERRIPMWTAIRKSILPALLVLEIALVVSLRSAGWDSTTASIRWGASFFAATIPLLLAAIILFRNGHRFQLRSLMIAVFFVALFLFVTVMPILDASRARRGSRSLALAGAELQTESMLYDYYNYIGVETDIKPSASLQANAELPSWMLPLAGKLLGPPTDAAIREIWLDRDTEISELCRLCRRFPNLERFSLYGPGVTPAGMEQLAANTDNFPKLESIHLRNVALPIGWLPSLNRIRTLFLWAEGPTAAQFQLSPKQLAEVASMPHLEVLMIQGYGLKDADMDYLSEGKNLTCVTLWHTGVTATGEERLVSSIPGCKVRRN
jgi:hypothetical protein